MKTLYFDCFSGASGDMIVGALLDAGADPELIRTGLEALELPGWQIDVQEVTRGGIRATKVSVTSDKHEAARSYNDIVQIIEASSLHEAIKRPALHIFSILGEAEASIHRVPLAEIHLHEVGGVDAIVDVVAACAALASLGPDSIVTSPIATGRGLTDSLHGIIPVPAPAVTAILAGVELIERGTEELITPTGAAILKGITDRFDEMPPMRLETVGYGAGTRDNQVPNVLRVLIGTSEAAGTNRHAIVEANVDDMTPEMIPFVIERLLEAGAQDAWTTPIIMKKGRPAMTIAALVAQSDLDAVLSAIYRETTTFGARVRAADKYELEREWRTVEVEGYELRVKVALHNGEVTTAAPEYEDALKIARISGLPLKKIYRLALARFEETF